MNTTIQKAFLDQLNQHMGIAHRISQAYQPDADDKADLLQEMIYQLWRSYPSFSGQSAFSTWMYRVCLNTALAYQRMAKKRKTEPLMARHEQVPDSTPDERQDRIKRLFEAIATLSPLNKAIVLLYLDELSYEQIATVTGLSKTNVSVRLVRIKKELESRLTEDCKTN